MNKYIDGLDSDIRAEYLNAAVDTSVATPDIEIDEPGEIISTRCEVKTLVRRLKTNLS